MIEIVKIGPYATLLVATADHCEDVHEENQKKSDIGEYDGVDTDIKRRVN